MLAPGILHVCVCVSPLQVLTKHCHVLGRGLLVDTPTIQNILSGDIPLIRSANEQLFLYDFISCKADTPGGRLARYILYIFLYILGTEVYLTSPGLGHNLFISQPIKKTLLSSVDSS